MVATVRHVISSSGLRKFQADGFLFDGMYQGIGCVIFCVVFLSPSISHSQIIIQHLAPAEFNSHAYGS